MTLADDLEALAAKLLGSGPVMICCHPDLEDDTPIDDEDRKCVLDLGRPQDCNIAEGDKLKSREQCCFWQTKHRIAPEPLTINEGKRLIEIIAALRAAERADVVEWLRDKDYWTWRNTDGLTREDYANMIERGEHTQESQP